MILDSSEVQALYRRVAPFYDAAVLPYRLLGLAGHRRRVVGALGVAPGDTVVDLCCGTGINFPLLHEAVGAGGRIVGVDLTDAMLRRARERAERAGWRNVELVQADVADFRLPEGVAGVLSTFGLEMVPEYDAVIRRAAATLPGGRRFALLGLKHPERWPEWLVRVGIFLNRPFGMRREYESFRPWISLRAHFRQLEYREMLWGAAYLAVGEVRGSAPRQVDTKER